MEKPRKDGFSRLDGFTKLKDEYRVGTVTGGIVSIAALLVTIFIFIVQIQSFLHPPVRQMFVLDTRRPVGPDGTTISVTDQANLQINFQITFPHVPCYMMHFDAIESVTELPLPLDETEITFTRFSQTKQKLGTFDPHAVYDGGLIDSDCGSCYAAKNETKCCATCHDVLEAYQSAGLKYPQLSQIAQCKDIMAKLQSMDNEGCQVTAAFKTVRIKSEFHVSPGMSSVINGKHFHDMRPFGKRFIDLNLSHTIDHFYFGDRESEETPQLTGFTSIQDKREYYRAVYMTNIMGNDYTSERYVVENSTDVNPGVSVEYDISPIYAIEYNARESITHLLTRMVTAAGGVIFMFRVLDATLYANDKPQHVPRFID